MFPSPEEQVIGIYNKLLMNKKNIGPSLVFDLARFEKNVSTIVAAIVDKNLRVMMALKACTINKVLNIASRYLDGFEISNLNELALLPGELKNIFVTNPALTIDQICKISSQCTATQVVFNLDSESQKNHATIATNQIDISKALTALGATQVKGRDPFLWCVPDIESIKLINMFKKRNIVVATGEPFGANKTAFHINLMIERTRAITLTALPSTFIVFVGATLIFLFFLAYPLI